ncbi:SPOR domain-containing protein [Pararobbsia silviterrae]|nr:SPOR domain-containing protein [Pararobbsia silviterrae]
MTNKSTRLLLAGLILSAVSMPSIADSIVIAHQVSKLTGNTIQFSYAPCSNMPEDGYANVPRDPKGSLVFAKNQKDGTVNIGCAVVTKGEHVNTFSVTWAHEGEQTEFTSTDMKLGDGEPAEEPQKSAPSEASIQTTPPQALDGKHIYVQLAKYKNLAQASAWAAYLNGSQGLSTFVLERDGVYLLRMGPFDARSEAESAVKKYRATGISDTALANGYPLTSKAQ